jgi:hypothetical protein
VKVEIGILHDWDQHIACGEQNVTEDNESGGVLEIVMTSVRIQDETMSDNLPIIRMTPCRSERQPRLQGLARGRVLPMSRETL